MQANLKNSVGKRVGQPIDKSNTYDATFDNLFCVCRTKYDPETECVVIQSRLLRD